MTADKVEETKEIQLKKLKEVEKRLKQLATQRIEPTVVIKPQELKKGSLCIAHVQKQNRLVEVVSVRQVPEDPIPWVRIHLLTSIDPLAKKYSLILYPKSARISGRISIALILHSC